MNTNSNLSSLPFYRSLNEQGYRLSYAYGRCEPLYAPKDRFLPFQLIVPKGLQASEVSMGIYDLEAEEETPIINRPFWIKEFTDYSVLIFTGRVPVEYEDSRDVTQGYLHIAFRGQHYYSEVMCMTDNLSDYLRIEWSSDKDIIYEGGRIVYEGDMAYVNVLYVRSQIGRPTYEFSEEGNDRNGHFFATKQISEKTYHFVFLATEPICDAFRLVGLSDNIVITDTFGRVYRCDTFSSNVSWQEQGYIASVECEFQTDTMVVQPAKSIEPDFALKMVFDGVTYEDGNEVIPPDGRHFLSILPLGLSFTAVASDEDRIGLVKTSGGYYVDTVFDGEPAEAYITVTAANGETATLYLTSE